MNRLLLLPLVVTAPILGACAEEDVGKIENKLPVAAASASAAPQRGVVVTFTSLGSTDPDGELVEFNWDFGDDTTGTGATAEHIYNAAGTFTAKLTVVDDDGGEDDADVVVVVDDNAPPTAVITAPDAGSINVSVRFDGSQSSDAEGAIAAFDWDFDDGTTGTGPTFDKSFTTAGTFVVTLTVRDGDGATASAEHTIVVDDAPPSLNGAWSWFLTDESLRDLGFSCDGSFQDSQLTVLAAAPNITMTEQAGDTTVAYSGTLTGDDFDVENEQFGIVQRIFGTFTSPTEFEGFYGISSGLGPCQDRPVAGVKQ